MTASLNNTIVTDHVATITDKSGNVWAITALGQVSINGKVDPTTAHVVTLAYENGVVWQMSASRLVVQQNQPDRCVEPDLWHQCQPAGGRCLKQ